MSKLSDFLSSAKVALHLDIFIPRAVKAVEEGEDAGMEVLAGGEHV